MTVALACDGLIFGRLRVPPFRCLLGETICLHAPSVLADEVYDLPKVLTGEIPLPGLRVGMAARFADRPIPTRGFLGFLHNPRLDRWLERVMGLPPAAAKELAARYGLSLSLKIGVIGWTEKSLITLEAALMGPAQLVVFDTYGFAPPSIRELCATAEARREGRAVVALTRYPRNQGACFGAGHCVELKAANEPSWTEVA